MPLCMLGNVIATSQSVVTDLFTVGQIGSMGVVGPHLALGVGQGVCRPSLI